MPKLETFFDDTGRPLPNVAADKAFSDDQLNELADKLLTGVKADEASMKVWKTNVDKALEMAEEDLSPRSEPIEGSANFKTPHLNLACKSLSDQIFIETLRDREICKFTVKGQVPDEIQEVANRRAKYQNYQLNESMAEWREEHERLIYRLPYVGSIFKKTTYDPYLQRPVSNIIDFPDFIVNQDTPSLARLRRFTERFTLWKNEVVERQVKGFYRDADLEAHLVDGASELVQDKTMEDAPQDMYEVMGWADLDEDGYEEPYTFTIHIASSQILAITPRYSVQDVKRTANGRIYSITPFSELTHYRLCWDSDAGFLGKGYPWLMGSLIMGINSTTNMLQDAGKFNTLPGGWLAKGVKEKMGTRRMRFGAWAKTGLSAAELQSGFRPFDAKEPSATLYQMNQDMQTLVREVAAVVEDDKIANSNVTEAAALALIQEKQKTLNAVVLRIHQTLTQELAKIDSLNATFSVLEYEEVTRAPHEQDFSVTDIDIAPTSNPDASNRLQRLKQASAELAQAERVAAVGGNVKALLRSYYKALGTQNIDEILPEVTPEQELQQLLQRHPELQQVISGEQERNKAIVDAQLSAVEREQAREDAKAAADIDKKAAETELIKEKTITEDVKNDIEIQKTAKELDT